MRTRAVHKASRVQQQISKALPRENANWNADTAKKGSLISDDLIKARARSPTNHIRNECLGCARKVSP
jgi:hypothetical protein